MIDVTNNSSFNDKTENKKDKEIPPGLLLNYPHDLSNHPHWGQLSPIPEPSISVMMIVGTFVAVCAIKIRKILKSFKNKTLKI